MALRGRLGVIVCAAVLAAMPLPARSANVRAYAVDSQGATGRLNGTSGSYAEFDVVGENFRAIVLQPPIVALTTRSHGCVTFTGQQVVSGCGNDFVVTMTGVLSSAQIIGTVSTGEYTISVNVTVSATELPDPRRDAGAGCTPSITPSTPPSPSVPPSPSPSPLPVPSPPAIATPMPTPTVVPSRTCVVYASPGVEREGVTAGTITLSIDNTVVGKATSSDAGWTYGTLLAEADLFTP